MAQSCRQVFAKDGNRGFGLVLRQGAAELAEGSGPHEAQEFSFGEYTADHRAEAAGHPRLGPFRTLEDGFGIKHRSGAVCGAGLHGQFVQNLEDAFADQGSVWPLGFR